MVIDLYGSLTSIFCSSFCSVFLLPQHFFKARIFSSHIALLNFYLILFCLILCHPNTLQGDGWHKNLMNKININKTFSKNMREIETETKDKSCFTTNKEYRQTYTVICGSLCLTRELSVMQDTQKGMDARQVHCYSKNLILHPTLNSDNYKHIHNQ